MVIEETPSAAAPTGSVLLDIGAGAGAAVVLVDERLLGHEVEVRPVSGAGRPAHADVLERATPTGPLHAVVIGGLAGGSYTVWLDGDTACGELTVRCGEVTELDMRGAGLRVSA